MGAKTRRTVFAEQGLFLDTRKTTEPSRSQLKWPLGCVFSECGHHGQWPRGRSSLCQDMALNRDVGWPRTLAGDRVWQAAPSGTGLKGGPPVSPVTEKSYCFYTVRTWF